MKTREKGEVESTTEKGKTFGTVSTITTEADQGKVQTMEGAVVHQNGQAAELKLPIVKLKDLMSLFDHIDKKLKCSEEDRQESKKELRHNKKENLDDYFILARANEEKLQQMVEKVETTDKEREKHITKNMEEMKRVYENVETKLWNLETKLWSLETKMVTMSSEKAESSFATHSKLDAVLRNSIAQEKIIPDKTE